MIRKEISYTEADLLHAALLHARHQGWRICLMTGGIVMAVVVGVALLTGEWPAPFDWGLLALLPVLLWLAFLIVLPRASARRQFRQTPVFRLPVINALSEEGVAQEQGDNRWVYSWDQIIRTRADSKVILLYTNPYAYLLMPTRVLDAAEHKEALRIIGQGKST